MKITEIPPAEPTYHIALSQEELDVLYWSIDKGRFESGRDSSLAHDMEEALVKHANVDRF